MLIRGGRGPIKSNYMNLCGEKPSENQSPWGRETSFLSPSAWEGEAKEKIGGG